MKNGNIPPIYDARALGLPRMTLLGLQHVFAMFGATVIVPLITGLDVSTLCRNRHIDVSLHNQMERTRLPRIELRFPWRIRLYETTWRGTRNDRNHGT